MENLPKPSVIVIDYITANGTSDTATLTAEITNAGHTSIRAEKCLRLATAKGNIVKTNDDYSLPV